MVINYRWRRINWTRSIARTEAEMEELIRGSCMTWNSVRYPNFTNEFLRNFSYRQITHCSDSSLVKNIDQKGNHPGCINTVITVLSSVLNRVVGTWKCYFPDDQWQSAGRRWQPVEEPLPQEAGRTRRPSAALAATRAERVITLGALPLYHFRRRGSAPRPLT